MQSKGLKTNDGMLANFRYRKKWKRATSVLSIFVVIGTISSLMLPAITMNQYICGQDEHTHGADCYSAAAEPVLSCDGDSLGLHRHTSPCCDAEGNLICDQVDFVVHAHDSACFSGDGALVCTLREVAEHSHDESCYQTEEIVIDEGHSHSDSCYEMVTSETPTCGAEESSGHHHGEGCYATGTELLCTIPESQGHSHLEECFGEDGEILCGQEESSGHTHEAGCFAEAGTLLCATPESDGHQHSEECFGLVRGGLICTEEEREPVIEQGEPELICEKEEVILHSHEEDCYSHDDQGSRVELLCQEPEILEHQHGETCFTQQEVTTLTCTLPEHTHTEECEPLAGLSEEEQALVDALIARIDALPDPEGIRAHLAELDEAGDSEGREALIAALAEQVAPVWTQYGAMTEEQKAAVTNGAKLVSLNALLPVKEPAVSDPVYYCNQEEHSHGDGCRDEEGNLTCSLPEHSHTRECLVSVLTEEEQAAVDAVVALIDALPLMEEVDAQMLELAEEEEALNSYRAELALQINTAYVRYLALSEAQQAAVANVDILMALEAFFYPPLTGEEQAAVDALDALIEGMPAVEEVQARVAAFDEEDDMEGLNAYMEALLLQVQEAKRVYDEMTGMQKASLRNREKLDGLIALLSPEAETLADYGDISLLDTGSTVSAMSGDIATVSGGQGITFKLFDYSTGINTYLGQQIPGINSGTIYYGFRGQYSTATTVNETYDKDGFYYYETDGLKDGQHKPNHATVKYNLKNGYPALDLTHHGYLDASGISVDGASLGVLFGAGNNSDYVREYYCSNTPMKYHPSTGYYTYSSAQNAADYNTSTNTWYVRNYRERGASTATYHDGSYWDFMPFNHKTTTKVNPDNNREYNYESTELDYWYGMTMNVDFFQPKNGKVNNSDMIFEFSGDDDVWVFIDNKLVLDLGGTHGQVSGNINFQTGLVEMYLDWSGTNAKTEKLPNHYKASTLYECFKAAFEEAGKTPEQVQEELNKVFVRAEGQTTSDAFGNVYDVYRFKDYTTHSVDHFFLERGAGSANCNIKFNLPALPKESLTVGKDITFVDDQGKPDTEVSVEAETFAKHNLTYTFRVLDQTTDLPVIKNATIYLVDDMGNSTGEMVTVDSNGYFTLKADQRVRFDNMLGYTNTAYYVEESIPTNYTFQYGDISYGDGGLMEGLVNNETRFTTYRTKEMYPDQSNIVVYTNQVISEHMSFLVIKKETLPGSDLKPEDRFPFKVSLGGVPVEQGTEFVDTENRNILLKADSNGVIYLASGQSVMLNNPIIAGTSFQVEELDKEGWQVDRMEGTYKSNGEKDYADGDTIHITGATADGEIPVNTTATVTAYNKTYAFGTELPLSKQFRGANAQLTDFSRFATFSIEQVKDAAGTPLDEETLRVPSVIPDVTLECLGQNVTTGGITIGYLSTAEKKDYYYRIVEISSSADPKENFINDASVYVFQITVTEGAANITAVYKDGVRIDANSTAAFVNTLAIVELPATGGIGTTPYTFSGWAIILTACALMYNSKRKQRKGAR